ncbi:MAG: hypothetical protein HS117_17280 [Verrucomicrobiaceae bacterium]|nr:hypothetical protein [Verrucomicrobiaceae bacterium]
MKLTHFALALMTILVGITGYLAWEGQQEAKGQKEMLEYQRKKIEALEASKPVPASFAPINTTPVAPQSAAIPAMAGGTLLPGTPGGSTPAPLTPLQKQVLGMPALAKVTVAEPKLGFVEIDAGRNKNLVKGQKYDVRRGNGLVGRVVISETIEQQAALADIDPGVTIPGVTIEAGDELIVPVSK